MMPATRSGNPHCIYPLAALGICLAYARNRRSRSTVKLFKNGRNQAVRIPREFELPGDEAVMRKEGARLIIELKPARSLLTVLQGLKPISEDFAPVADLPAQAGRPVMRYLLDTSIVSDLVRNPQGQVAQKTRRVGERRVCTSIIVASELRSGAAKRQSPRLTAQLEAVLGALEVLPFEASADVSYGTLRARLERSGRTDWEQRSSGRRPSPCPRIHHRQR